MFCYRPSVKICEEALGNDDVELEGNTIHLIG